MTQYPGIRVTISAAGRRRLEAEQRRDRLYAEIRLGTIGGAVLVIAGLIVKQLLGA